MDSVYGLVCSPRGLCVWRAVSLLGPKLWLLFNGTAVRWASPPHQEREPDGPQSCHAYFHSHPEHIPSLRAQPDVSTGVRLGSICSSTRSAMNSVYSLVCGPPGLCAWWVVLSHWDLSYGCSLVAWGAMGSPSLLEHNHECRLRVTATSCYNRPGACSHFLGACTRLESICMCAQGY